MHQFHTEPLEPRQLFNADIFMPPADLRADADRNGVITAADDLNEDHWTGGKTGRGALVLPNFDRDNTLPTGAPDNWTGGVWNGRPAAPNNVIDNAADLKDIAKLRMRKLGPTDAAYNYRVTLQILRPANDPAWFKQTAATDRVRVFFPTLAKAGGDVVCQPGDAAVIGPSLGDTIRFVRDPIQPNEYSVMDLAGDGWLEFGVEGIKAGAQVRFKVTVEYDPLIISSQPAGGGVVDPGFPDAPPPAVDIVTIRVSPFVLSDNRQRVKRMFVENMNRIPGFDNSAMRTTLRQAFGTKLVETRTGDLWQQDGYEVGYVKAPYGQMPVVLELPRARISFFDPVASMRSFVRGSLLGSGVGVSTEVATLPDDTASAFGGDIESISRGAGKPGYLLSSGMPASLRSYFDAQGVNPIIDLKLDDWLAVAHVDEVVQMNSAGTKALVADADLAWALLLWAQKLDQNVRGFAGMNGIEQLPDTNADGIKISALANNTEFRRQNLLYAGAASRLGAVQSAVKKAMNLTEELTAPTAGSMNAGSAKLLRGGAFASLLGTVKRTFDIRFLDADRYQLRYRDGTGAWSTWADGRRSRDEVFPGARAFLFKHYWTGVAKAGDRFTFSTNPGATLVKMPVLLGSPFLIFSQPGDPAEPAPRLAAFSTNMINSVVDGQTVVAGSAFGPRVNWRGGGKSDLFQDYAAATFRSAGYSNILFTDTRLYHNGGGGIHCGTNTLRDDVPSNWWE